MKGQCEDTVGGGESARYVWVCEVGCGRQAGVKGKKAA